MLRLRLTPALLIARLPAFLTDVPTGFSAAAKNLTNTQRAQEAAWQDCALAGPPARAAPAHGDACRRVNVLGRLPETRP